MSVIGQVIASLLASKLFIAALIRDTFSVRLDGKGVDVSQLVKAKDFYGDRKPTHEKKSSSICSFLNL